MNSTLAAPRFLNPTLLASHFHIDTGATVLDVGSGLGTFIPSLVKKVGGGGKVVACDVERGHIDTIAKTCKRSGFNNVDPRWCDIEVYESTRLGESSVDYVIIINTLYQLTQPTEALREVYRTVRSGGMVYVVDWQESFSGLGPMVDVVVSRDAAICLFEASLFILERDYPAGAFHYGLAFRKL